MQASFKRLTHRLLNVDDSAVLRQGKCAGSLVERRWRRRRRLYVWYRVWRDGTDDGTCTAVRRRPGDVLTGRRRRWRTLMDGRRTVWKRWHEGRYVRRRGRIHCREPMLSWRQRILSVDQHFRRLAAAANVRTQTSAWRRGIDRVEWFATEHCRLRRRRRVGSFRRQRITVQLWRRRGRDTWRTTLRI